MLSSLLMASEALLQQIADDLADIKERMGKMEVVLEELDSDFHEVRPTYLQKLEAIKQEQITIGNYS